MIKNKGKIFLNYEEYSLNFLRKEELRIAVLSYSTKGSGTSELVSKVVTVTDSIIGRNPNLKINGELQLYNHKLFNISFNYQTHN